ncbi:MAG TPA: zinc ribbon domain-containing protein [Blastocatellia bacterium]|nr:zinc ribbon domain-containing protein [Blastocatellia bacterium]
MFCPTCGKDNSRERKFCVSCGTNLEAVSQALADSRADFFTRTDKALDQFIARYAEHVFRDAPAQAADESVGKSWKALGQGVVTSLIDLILFSLMWNIFPLRFLMLLISSPIRLLAERGNRQKMTSAGQEKQTATALPARAPGELSPGSGGSVSEHTTEKLREYRGSVPEDR